MGIATNGLLAVCLLAQIGLAKKPPVFTRAEARMLVKQAPEILVRRLADHCLHIVDENPEAYPRAALLSVFDVCGEGKRDHKFAMYFVDLDTGLLEWAGPGGTLVESPRLRATRQKLLAQKAKKQ